MGTDGTCATIFIRSTCEEVFDLIIDTSRHPEYVKGYVDQMSGPRILKKGTEFIWRVDLYGTVFRVYSFVSTLEYPRLYQERMHVPGLFRVTLTDVLEKTEGGVRFTSTWRYAPVSWSASGLLAQRLMNGQSTFREGALETIDGMKRLLERSA